MSNARTFDALSPAKLSRRWVLQASAALGAAAVAGGVRANRPRPLLDDAELQGTFAGVRYDRDRGALVLAGEPGTHEVSGTYTSAPFRCGEGTPCRLDWRSRWTTPLQWERSGDGPILDPTPGSWDDTMVSTCSIVPAGDSLRIYYGARDRGIGLAVARADEPRRWHKRGGPLLRAGEAGTFDAGGVLSPAVCRVTDSHWFMYYVGYDPTRVRGAIKVHQIGLAESHDGGETWSRVSREPVLALGPEGSCDGATLSSNTVLRIGDRWFCWYTGMSQIPYLASVCLATSEDGIHWQKYPHNPVLSFNPYVEAEAFIVATPHVLHEEGVYKMWYNAKGYGSGREPGDYRICYAESLDGIRWERCPLGPVLNPSAGSAWDSLMVEYPEVLHLGGTYHLWYCGNDYGRFGHAIGRAVAQATVQTRTGPSRTPDARWTRWTAAANGASLAGLSEYLQVRVVLETTNRRITPMIQQLQCAA